SPVTGSCASASTASRPWTSENVPRTHAESVHAPLWACQRNAPAVNGQRTTVRNGRKDTLAPFAGHRFGGAARLASARDRAGGAALATVRAGAAPGTACALGRGAWMVTRACVRAATAFGLGRGTSFAMSSLR